MSVFDSLAATFRRALLVAALVAPAPLLAESLCAPGSWSASGHPPCALATPGFYVPGTGARSQTKASAGYYVPGPGAKAQIPAPPGYYVPTPGATQPTIAPAGTYVATIAATKAISAPVGYYAPRTGMTAPIPAGLGFFVPRDRQVVETAAAAGYYVGTPAAKAQTLCPLQTNSYGQAPACRFTGGSLPVVPGSIGPRFTASFVPGATIDLGTFGVGTTLTLSSWIQNGSTDLLQLLGDPNQPARVLALTQLSLLGTTVGSVPQVTTSLLGLPAGTVLGEGAMQTFDIAITGRQPGAFVELLTFQTDQTANFGRPGQSFRVAFTGTVTPEPSTLSLVALGALVPVVTMLRRRRS